MQPTEAEILEVMSDTGMGRIQAIHHLQSRYILQRRMRRGEDSRVFPPTEPAVTSEAVQIADLAIAKAMAK